MSDRAAHLLEIHRQYLAGDPRASAQLFDATHRPLVRVLLGEYGKLPEEVAIDLATDAIVEYLTKPGNFDPNRAGLFTYLAMVAKGDALNWIASKKRAARGHRKFVELQDPDGNIERGPTGERVDAEAILRKYGHQIVESEADANVLRLMLVGEQETDEYADVLGVRHLPQAERKAAVKKVRDRLEKRLKRLGEQL